MQYSINHRRYDYLSVEQKGQLRAGYDQDLKWFEKHPLAPFRRRQPLGIERELYRMTSDVTVTVGRSGEILEISNPAVGIVVNGDAILGMSLNASKPGGNEKSKR